MRLKTATTSGLALLMLVAAVPSAQAASSRAEYITQVDPICQAGLGPRNDAATAYNRNFKLWLRDLSHGSLKNWVRQTRKTAQSLFQLNQVHSTLTEQIAAVPPFAQDAATINTWLNDRRQAEAFANSSAAAFARFRFGQADKRLRRADALERAGISAISGFGFQVCGVSI